MSIGQGRPATLDAGWTAALCGGVLAQLYAPALMPGGLALGLLVCAVLVAVADLRRCRRFPVSQRGSTVTVMGWLGAFVIGAALCALHGRAALDRRLPIGVDEATVRLDVRIAELPEFRGDGARFIADIEGVVQASPGLSDALTHRRIALRWYGGGRELQPGELWRLAIRLRPWLPPRNPGDPDDMRRALVAGIDVQGVVLGSDRPLRLGASDGLHAIRAGVSARIVEVIGAEQARFVAALAVGDTRGLSDEDWERLRQFGLTHLIAISGFHVGMVAGLGIVVVRVLWWLWPILAHRWRRRPAAAFAALVVATAYAGLAGFSLPTVRTVLMVGVVALFVCRRRPSPPAQPLLLAITILALADPMALLTPGFWLSCGGVAWLLWCLPGTAHPWSLREFLKAQWVATLGLLPLGAAFFLQVPVAGPVANLVAIPWISLVVVPLSLVGTLLMPVSDTLSAWAWHGASIAMAGLWWGLGSVPDVATASRWLPPPPWWAIALALLGVAIALLPRGLPWRYAGALLLLPMLFPPVLAPPAGEFTVTAFALPRGDSVLVRTASHTVLVDAGPDGTDLPRRLRAAGVERIDLRIETRRKAGRRGGGAAVDRAFPPSMRWVAPGSAAQGRLQRCEAGRAWAGDGVEILALSPAPGSAGATADDACVLRVTSASGRAVWLVSDAGRWVARRMAAPSTADAVIGAPGALDEWRTALAVDVGMATRAPGPSLSQRWPEDLHRVDRDGALAWHSAIHAPPEVLRDGTKRWWFLPAR